ncbi:transporter substrate-binding domain-containing protein [Photorhabdus laumondii subsp. laumondii]|uniref:Photorhabdus luminescens subsp. laumondii TTO1 complete genome segment 1/17 n=2 Tax=Photorhabdus laumondii subsp. laumondii TaxID=141679 RepID=Q7N9U2_PHOLL|nr:MULTISPECIES: ABC transporter substrate-binding protein [Photorhabdus]AWK40213.1 amino acid ABC transporter substrate-binding protein [Photorhabdus laumondii subsp. laumondii]AXG41046.1 amino acid ABC transporter substrate-binding protein [Photorhabdus laumondii subsp. laumondii]AXG45559.1 amino acid ABC transporter substrate-binding protein [Photorhabdus laumondii subsp. laumondii]KTL60356.1 amino acid ABC transporter substrate-binding protein [Photorhabdus laumondii subsp. laumondii]MCC83
MKSRVVITALLAGLTLVTGAAKADKLDDIKKTGAVRIAVFDSNPPFGFIDPQTKKLAGYDVDIANAIANDLGVKLELRPTNPANRLPLLASKKVDLIAANFTVTHERAKQVDFSIPYFATGQKFIARKGILKSPEDIKNLRIGADKGTVQEITLREHYPTAKVISYDDTPLAFAALRNGNVQAITQDDAKLVGLLANVPEAQKAEFEISPFSITREYQAVAAAKGQERLVEAVNQTLLKLEKEGEAAEIYNRWFGPETKSAQPRGDFKFAPLEQQTQS